MTKTTWQVWTEPNPSDGQSDLVLFQGSKTAAHTYYKQNGVTRAGLHVGYILPDDDKPSPTQPEKEPQS